MLTRNDMFADELEKIIGVEIVKLQDRLTNPASGGVPDYAAYKFVVGQVNGMQAVLGYFDEVKKKIAETL